MSLLLTLRYDSKWVRKEELSSIYQMSIQLKQNDLKVYTYIKQKIHVYKTHMYVPKSIELNSFKPVSDFSQAVFYK